MKYLSKGILAVLLLKTPQVQMFWEAARGMK
jgi:hypothetical protein